MNRTHQLGEERLEAILCEEIEWRPFAAFPPGVMLAAMVGDPRRPGPYLTRVKAPHGVRLMPHRHPEDRIYTVISGIFYVGLGEEFDGDEVTAYPPGTVIVLPGNTWHFHWAKSGEYISQISAIGPLGMEYANPEDDPRNNAKQPRGVTMLIQSVHFRFAPGDADKADGMLEELREKSRAEDGVIGFDVMRSREKSNEFALWEQYRDDAALESHKATEHYKRLVLEGIRQFAQQRDAVVGRPG